MSVSVAKVKEINNYVIKNIKIGNNTVLLEKIYIRWVMYVVMCVYLLNK